MAIIKLSSFKGVASTSVTDITPARPAKNETRPSLK